MIGHEAMEQLESGGMGAVDAICGLAFIGGAIALGWAAHRARLRPRWAGPAMHRRRARARRRDGRDGSGRGRRHHRRDDRLRPDAGDPRGEVVGAVAGRARRPAPAGRRVSRRRAVRCCERDRSRSRRRAAHRPGRRRRATPARRLPAAARASRAFRRSRRSWQAVAAAGRARHRCGRRTVRAASTPRTGPAHTSAVPGATSSSMYGSSACTTPVTRSVSPRSATR